MNIKHWTMAPVFTILFLTVLFGQNVAIVEKIKFSIKEELPANTLIGNIGNTSGIKLNYTAEEYDSINYRFLDSTIMNTRFVINSDNGNLFTAVVLDRETICGHQELCIMAFDVAAFSNVVPIFEFLSVEVLIMDENDNIPTFPTSSVTFNILESSVVGSILSLDEADDKDSTRKNSIKSYEIFPKDFGMFGLNVSGKPDGGFFLKLVLLKNLDRETNDSYQFHVVARDGGVKENVGTLVVNIVVTDYNDHSPVFEKDMYNMSVNEGIAVGSLIVKLLATDKDVGDNAKISYGFSSRQADMATISALFDINSITGELTVKGNLVYQENKVYKIFVEARDHGEQSRVTQATVLVTVQDVGNNAPIVSVNFLSSGSKKMVNVSEASNQETVIAHVNVVDTDSGLNGKVACTISSIDFALQAVAGKGYIVVVNRTLDRETKDMHNLTITCSDQGTPVLTSAANFFIRVTDENDNAPKFKEKTFFAFVEENRPVGEVIKQVSATDADLSRNAQVFYYLDKDADGKFAINSNSGVITTHDVFDREDISQYSFTVLAVDSGNPPMTGSATVVLTVTDKNDNPPTFDVEYFQFFVEENQPADTLVGTLSANDLDDGDNGLVTFSLAPSYLNHVPFYILPNGEIKTNLELNRETKDEYRFEIIATDKGTHPKEASTLVIVHVTDANDLKPIIVFPNKKNNTVSVSFLSPVGSTITTIKAYDLDEEGPNSRLSYFIKSGNTLDIFAVGQTSGNVYLKRTYPIQTDQTFTITILVRDNGQYPKEASYPLNIILKYSNESSSTPVPEHSNTNIIIAVVVVCFTVIISIAIIATIFILRRHDRHLKLKDTEDKNKTFTKPEVVVDGALPGEKLKNNVCLPEIHGLDTPKKKKKEVSFSFDEAYDSMNPEFASSTGSNDVFHDKCYRQDEGHLYSKSLDKGNSQMKMLHLHQIHLQTNDQRSGLNQPSFDDISESSGETANSDSGKGGSDVDLSCQLNCPDELAAFQYFGKKQKPVTLSSQQSSAHRPRIHHSKHSDKYHKQKTLPSSVDVFHTDSELINKTLGSKLGNTQNLLQLGDTNSYSHKHIDSNHKQKTKSKTPGQKWVPSYV